MTVCPPNQVKVASVSLSTDLKHVVGGDASRVALILSNGGGNSIDVYMASVNPTIPFIHMPTNCNPIVLTLAETGDVVIQGLQAVSKDTGSTLLVTEVVVY